MDETWTGIALVQRNRRREWALGQGDEQVGGRARATTCVAATVAAT